MDSRPIHDDEPDTSEVTLRALLADQRPDWVSSPVTYINSTGTSNAMWRVHLPGDRSDVVVRLPRSRGAAESVERECGLLRAVADSLKSLVATPSVEHVGTPSSEFPYVWTALSWLSGDDLWHRQPDETAQTVLVDDVVAVVESTQAITVAAPRRQEGDRGGPIGGLIGRLERWLTDPRWEADKHLDVQAVQRITTAACEEAFEPRTDEDCFVHGDLIPGNLLVSDGRLSAVIDWGGAGVGDPAQDFAPAWSIFDAPAREMFRERLAISEPTWQRARLFELEHAVGGIVYYAPRQHALADVMRATLGRLLATD